MEVLMLIALQPQLDTTNHIVDPSTMRVSLSQHEDIYQVRYADLFLESRFQPIFSLSHRRIVGHEALLQATTETGARVPTEQVFAIPSSEGEMLSLDRMTHVVHLANFMRQRSAAGWLFLNINPRVFVAGKSDPEFFPRLLAENGCPAQRVVIEVLEDQIGEQGFEETVQFYRELGCLIAIDDFGVGHSNFDRVWRLGPEIVKLDRSMVCRAATESRVRRMMQRIVSLLHEAGALALLEGVETAAEAQIAMDTDADLVQGYYLAMPEKNLLHNVGLREKLDGIWCEFEQRSVRQSKEYRERIAPHINAIGYAASLLEAGLPMEQAVAGFLHQPNVEHCYLINSEGQQTGQNIAAPGMVERLNPRYEPLLNASGAKWSTRDYFRNAMAHPGKVQVTRPYLSITGTVECVTLSMRLIIDGEVCVLCGDVNWADG
jgi:EAL domain-containing protein (putative c-di-GMP-specific phosphodiesterase class I)